MSKNPEDEKLVTKEEAKSVVMDVFENYTEEGINWPTGMCIDCSKAIDQLPAVSIKSPEEIEQVIKNLEESFDEMKSANYPFGSYWDLRRNINLLNYVLNRPQEIKDYPGSDWTDEELLG